MWVLYLEIVCGAFIFIATVLWTLKGVQWNKEEHIEPKEKQSSPQNDQEL